MVEWGSTLLPQRQGPAETSRIMYSVKARGVESLWKVREGRAPEQWISAFLALVLFSTVHAVVALTRRLFHCYFITVILLLL